MGTNSPICCEKASRKLKQLGAEKNSARASPLKKKKQRSALNILAGEDLERLLERLDLGLAPCHALLVAHARIHAARLELVVVREGGVELTLRTLEVLLRRRELPVLARLQLLLVVGLRRLRRAVHGAVRREGLVLLRAALLRRGRVALKAREVRRDHLEHADDAAALRLLALERRVERFRRVVHRRRLLHERGRLRGLGVELLQHREGRLHRLLRRFCVRNRRLVLRLLLGAKLRRLRHGSVQLRDLLGQVRELLGQLAMSAVSWSACAVSVLTSSVFASR